MMYRAKVTKIINIVEDHINCNTIRYVREQKDTYMEVRSEELAEVLESLNKCKEKEIELINKLEYILED